MYATLADGFTQRVVLAGQANNGQWGPTGLAFTTDGALLVANFHDGHVYRVAPDGRPDPEPFIRDLGTVGLATLPGGHVLATGMGAQAALELDPGARAICRRYPCDLGRPVGAALDPRGGRVLVTLLREHALAWLDLASGAWILAHAGPPLDRPDGLAFDADGNAFVGCVGSNQVVRLAADGSIGAAADVPGEPDGIAVAGPSGPLQGAVFVSCHDGALHRLDHDGRAWRARLVASGGTRGDHMVIGPDRRLYLTQTDEILQIGPPSF